jgi:tRNA modification GTPase
MNSEDTIFALSSGSGRAGIAVVRISGSRSRDLIEMFAGRCPEPRKAVVRKLRDPTSATVIDEMLVLWFPSPATVTGEDMAEFHVHGSAAVVAELFRCFGNTVGLRLAEPGEFTRRAYVNGRMDLVEVEGLSDLLEAKTETQRRLAMRQFLGDSSSIYDVWRSRLLMALALIEAGIDFSDEEDVASDAFAQAIVQVIDLRDELFLAVAQSSRVGLLRSGVKVVIAGVPNVGKSSLLNALAKRPAAIVSADAGTTRDVIEVNLDLGGVSVLLTDTAGLRDDTASLIEALGIERAVKEIIDADILISVTTYGQHLDWLYERKPDIVVVNKCDGDFERRRVDSIHMRNEFPNSEFCLLSVKSGYGLDDLLTMLTRMVRDHVAGSEEALIVRTRHGEAVQKSIRHLNDALVIGPTESELVADHVRLAARALASITGHIDVEDMLGKIFSSFCIGK